MSEDWKQYWENYLKNYEDVPGEKTPTAFKIDLKDIDFYIPPLLGADVDSMKAIAKHNAKHRIFG
jgi:hypothetical protein